MKDPRIIWIVAILAVAFMLNVWAWVKSYDKQQDKPQHDPNEVYFVFRSGIYYIYRICDDMFLYQDGTWGPYVPFKVMTQSIKDRYKSVIAEMNLVVRKKPKGFQANFG